MNGMHNLGLAKALADAHREELTRSMRPREGPNDGVRAVLGSRLVRLGTWLQGGGDRSASPTPAVEC